MGKEKVQKMQTKETVRQLFPSDTIQRLNAHTSVTRFRGNDGINELLASGGVSSSGELVKFIARHLLGGYRRLPSPAVFDFAPGCTAIHVPNRAGSGWLFGRGYDFLPHDLMILKLEPEDGYASINSVDTTMITDALGKLGKWVPPELIKKFALYLPVDGLNEKGLAISVNMIDDDVIVNQSTGKTNHIIVTLIRTILDKAANVEETVTILKNSDLHTWKGFFFHLAIADAAGRCVAAEYIHDELAIVESPIITNFYLQAGPKYGIGTEQSHIRYDRLTAHRKDHPALTPAELRDELKSVAKSNFPDDFHTTEWSVVYDQQALTATYYRREHYTRAYQISLK